MLGFISLTMSLLSAYGALANCRDDIIASTPDQDFTLHNDGTATHNPTGLMWMRCSLGQSWDGNSCVGLASNFTWSNALVSAQVNSFAGHTDWRLPSKNELASLLELSCEKPAINTMVFPNTPNKWYWSSSPFAFRSNLAWGVDFGFSGAFSFENIDSGSIRLVRAGQ